MSKYVLIAVACTCSFVSLNSTVRSEEPKIAYQEGPQYKYLLEKQKKPRPTLSDDPIEGYLSVDSRFVAFGESVAGLPNNDFIVDDSYHDSYSDGFDVLVGKYYISGARANTDIPHWKDVVWQWENDSALQEKRVKILKELARNYASVILDSERGRLLEVTLNGGRGNPDYPATYHKANHIPADDALLVRVIEAFPELRTLNLWAVGPEITDKGIAELPRLKYLQRLKIQPLSRYYCNVTNTAMLHIARCKNLVFLGMHGMHITDEAIEPLSLLPCLSRLHLTSLTLTPQCFVFIAKLPNIRTLTVDFHDGVLRASVYGRVYGQEVLDAIASLEGRLMTLDMPILGPDMLDVVCQMKPLSGLRLTFPRGQRGSVRFFVSAPTLKSMSFSYNSLLQYLKKDDSRSNWGTYENYQPKKE